VQLAASGIDRRHLQGRCGVSRGRETKSPPPRHDEPIRVLATVRGRHGSPDRRKRRVPFDRKATSRNGRGGVTEGRPRANNAKRARARGARRVLGRWKASWLPRRRSSSRGTPRRGPGSGDARKALQPSGPKRRPMTRGARYASEEGTSCLPSRDLPGGRWRTFSPIASARTRNQVTASSTLGATDGGFAAPPRTRRHDERWPPSLHLSAVLHGPGDGDGGTSVARCSPSPRKGGRPSQAVRLERAGRGAGANASARAETPQRRSGRGSDARGGARASSQSLQKSTDSDRRRESDAIHFTRFGWRSGTGA